MKLIPLTGKDGKGKFAIVDDEDFERVNKYKWFFNERYVKRTIYINSKTNKVQFLHRFILNEPQGLQVDHINRNTFDNRKENLRECTGKQNSHNIGIFSTNSSGFKGVQLGRKHRKKCWRATIWFEGKSIFLGLFDNTIDAAKAYNKAAKKYRGEFAYLNEIPKSSKKKEKVAV